MSDTSLPETPVVSPTVQESSHDHAWVIQGGFNDRGAGETSGTPGHQIFHVVCYCGAKQDMSQEDWDIYQATLSS